MKTSGFKSTPAIALIFLFSICSSQIPPSDISSKSETYRQQMAERATNALMAVRKIDSPISAEITNLILQEKFEEFENRSKYYEEQISKDPLYESPLFKLYEALDADSNHLLEKMNKWVEKKPSYISYAARGICKANQGWKIRGNKFVPETPTENLLMMHLFHEDAKTDLIAAIELNDRFFPAYCSLIGIEMAKGDTDSTKDIHDRAVRSIPETYYVRYDYLRSLQPRWGGSIELMEEYVNNLDKAAKKNPRIWSLKGELPAELGQIAWADSDYVSAIQYFTEALTYCERMSFLKYRGRLYMLTGQDGLALEDFLKYRKFIDADRVVNAYITSLTEKLGMNSPQKK